MFRCRRHCPCIDLIVFLLSVLLASSVGLILGAVFSAVLLVAFAPIIVLIVILAILLIIRLIQLRCQEPENCEDCDPCDCDASCCNCCNGRNRNR